MQTDVIEEITAAPERPRRESGAQKRRRLRQVSPAAPEGRVGRGKVRPADDAPYAAERAAAGGGDA